MENEACSAPFRPGFAQELSIDRRMAALARKKVDGCAVEKSKLDGRCGFGNISRPTLAKALRGRNQRIDFLPDRLPALTPKPSTNVEDPPWRELLNSAQSWQVLAKPNYFPPGCRYRADLLKKLQQVATSWVAPDVQQSFRLQTDRCEISVHWIFRPVGGVPMNSPLCDRLLLIAAILRSKASSRSSQNACILIIHSDASCKGLASNRQM
jgi:hypothetical protein